MSELNDKFWCSLQKLGIRPNEFPDEHFDGLCELKSVAPFIEWFCKNINEDNVLPEYKQDNAIIQSSKEDIPEDIAFPDLQNEYDKICASLEIQEDQLKLGINKLKLLENKLIEEEKAAIQKYNEIRKTFHTVSDKSDCDREYLDKAVEDTMKTCLSVEPDLPDLETWSQLSESMQSCLLSLSHKTIEEPEQSWRKEEEAEEELTIEDQLQIKLNSLKKVLSYVETNPAGVNLVVIDTVFENSDIIENQKKRRTKKRLERKLRKLSYLNHTLETNGSHFLNGFTLSTLSNAILESKIQEISGKSNAIANYVDCVTNDIANVEKLIKSIQQQSGGNEVFSPINVQEEELKEAVQKSQMFLDLLRTESEQNLQFRRNVGLVLSSLRNGPTLQLTPLPVSYNRLIYDLRDLSSTCKERLRRLAQDYHSAKMADDKVDRNLQLVWVYFLTEPMKYLSDRRDCSMSLSNLTFKSSERTFFGK